MFRVGQKVAYIGEHVPDGLTQIVKLHPLDIRSVYTVRDIFEHHSCRGITALYIQEVHNDIHPKYGLELAYPACCFRPIVSKSLEEDVSEFRKLLNVEPMDSTMFLLDILDKHVMEEE